MYRVGWPFWKWAARHAPLLTRLEGKHDKEVRVFIVTSPDLAGLVVEMLVSTLAIGLHKEINDCVSMLMADALKRDPKAVPVTSWPKEVLAA